MIFDTHCHLDQLSSIQLATQIDSSNLYLSMGTSSNNWNSLLRLSSEYDNVFPALGLHPWFVDTHWQIQIDVLSKLFSQHSISALGEIGLDFSKSHQATKLYQLEALEAQFVLAEQHNLPISLHVYKAHNELLRLLKRYSVTGVVHSLGSSLEIAHQYIHLGFKIGVNGIIARANASRYHALVKHLDLQHIVVETDAPNILLPGHSIAKLCDINTTIDSISNLTGLVREEVESITTYNARSIFSL